MNALLGSIPATTPDFLWSLVGSLHFMRLSLEERRTRGPVQSCIQEIGAIDGCPILRALCEGWDSQISPFKHDGERSCLDRSVDRPAAQLRSETWATHSMSGDSPRAAIPEPLQAGTDNPPRVPFEYIAVELRLRVSGAAAQ